MTGDLGRTKFAEVFEGHDLSGYSRAHQALYGEQNVQAMAELLAELCEVAGRGLFADNLYHWLPGYMERVWEQVGWQAGDEAPTEEAAATED